MGKSQLDQANGLLVVGSTTTEQTVGPALGGLLFSLSRAVPFAADAVSFLGSAGFLLGLGRRPTSPVDRSQPARDEKRATSLWVDMKAGLVWYRHNGPLCLVTGTVAVLAFCQAMVSGILVLFVLEHLHLDGAGYGLFMAGVAVGNVVGGAVAARLVRRVGTATVLVAADRAAAAGYLGAQRRLVGATSPPASSPSKP